MRRVLIPSLDWMLVKCHYKLQTVFYNWAGVHNGKIMRRNCRFTFLTESREFLFSKGFDRTCNLFLGTSFMWLSIKWDACSLIKRGEVNIWSFRARNTKIYSYILSEMKIMDYGGVIAQNR